MPWRCQNKRYTKFRLGAGSMAVCVSCVRVYGAIFRSLCHEASMCLSRVPVSRSFSFFNVYACMALWADASKGNNLHVGKRVKKPVRALGQALPTACTPTADSERRGKTPGECKLKEVVTCLGERWGNVCIWRSNLQGNNGFGEEGRADRDRRRKQRRKDSSKVLGYFGDEETGTMDDGGDGIQVRINGLIENKKAYIRIR